MRLITLVLILLIASLQWPMWLGKGGWYRVWQIDNALSSQRATNVQLTARNAALAAEVTDLKTGTEAIEERARSELGMIKKDEVFFHVLEKNNKISALPYKNASTPAASLNASTP
jgi:cell division protein FtsB